MYRIVVLCHQLSSRVLHFFLDWRLLMMLSALYQQVESYFTPSARKDLKTAVQVFAKALHYPDASHCPLEAYHRALPDLYQLLDTYLLEQGKGPHTIRNTKNNLSRMFRIADTHNLLRLKPATPKRLYSGSHGQIPPRPDTIGKITKNGSYLLFKAWPPQLVEAYQAFYDWATQPFVPGRDARLRKRPVTLR